MKEELEQNIHVKKLTTLPNVVTFHVYLKLTNRMNLINMKMNVSKKTLNIFKNAITIAFLVCFNNLSCHIVRSECWR